MTHMEDFDEELIRNELAHVLLTAVSTSGRTRAAIAQDAMLHKDAFRRILAGERSASVGEALRILAGCNIRAHPALVLCLCIGAKRTAEWLDTDFGNFLEEFLAELPSALERVLGNQLGEIRPRWAKGTAQRVARLLSDHIDELEKKDALYVLTD